jgi:hypothetical protein
MVRALLYEASNVMMTRCRADNWLKSWAFSIARRRGARKAKVGLARRLARGAASYVDRRNRLLHEKANSDVGLTVHHQSRSS